jgi:hypothetical protein
MDVGAIGLIVLIAAVVALVVALGAIISITLKDANGLELGTVKGRGRPSRTDQARQVAEEYASDQREIIKKLRKWLN